MTGATRYSFLRAIGSKSCLVQSKVKAAYLIKSRQPKRLYLERKHNIPSHLKEELPAPPLAKYFVVVEGERQGEHMAQTALRSGAMVPPEGTLEAQVSEARERYI